ncbi:unnamed protein product [Peronospora destructor]|uniref:FYVE-type domain-containing protein n=1 Tax=Peronospora destructor TaxID=86335 RepID=A0AAV0V4P9_9STRA|nr:unnamed protein product [Peronospora destructor]
MAMPEQFADASSAQKAAKEIKKAVPAVKDTRSTSSDSDKLAGDCTKPLDASHRSLRADSLGVDRSSHPHFKEGIRLAEMGKWTTLIERVASEPQLARHKDHHGMLPLHWACTEDDTPPNVVRALLAAFPEAVLTKNNAQYLPIQIAVKARAPLETLRLLVNARPSSLMEETPAGKTVIQLAKEMQLPQGTLEMLQRAEQEYFDLSEDDDDAFDYEDVKRDIEMQCQLLRESMLNPPMMNGPNASLPQSSPIRASFGHRASQNPFENSQNMVTTLSFVDGTLVQSHSNLSKSMSLSRKIESAPQVLVTDMLSSSPTSVPTLTRGAPTLGPARTKSTHEILEACTPAAADDDASERMIYESDHNAGVCGVCYRKFSMFRKKHQCKGCFVYLCKKHVAGRIMLPNFTKKRSACGDCYRIHRNGPMLSTTATTGSGAGVRAARASRSHISSSGPPIDKKGPNLCCMASTSTPSTVSASSTIPEAMDTISNNSLPSNTARPSNLLGSQLNTTRTTRAGSTHSMAGRPSNVPGPQINLRYSTNTIGARPNRVLSGGRTHGNNNTAISDTVVSLTESDHHAVDVSVLQYRVATLEECNKILMTRVADQERQYNEAMLLLTTTMTRVAEMEIRLPTEQHKSYRGTGGSTTASERASELDSNDKFSFPTPFVEKYD